MQAPVTTRASRVQPESGPKTRIAALAAAAIRAATMKKRRGSRRSARPSSALPSDPSTKPAWTLLVKSDWANPPSPYSAVSAGTTAEAENQSAMAATWQAESTPSEAHFEAPTTRTGPARSATRRFPPTTKPANSLGTIRGVTSSRGEGEWLTG